VPNCVLPAGTDLTTLNKQAPQAPRVIAHQSSATKGELLVAPAAYGEFQQQAALNDLARSASELYPPGAAAGRSVLCCPKRKAGRLNLVRAAFAYAHQEGVCSVAKDAQPQGGAPHGPQRSLSVSLVCH
jgi:hypothetical protein